MAIITSAYRRLLDAAIETNNLEVYASVLEFCDWYDAYHGTAGPEALFEKVQQLLEQISKGYTEPTTDISQPRLQAKAISKQYARGNFNLSKVDIRLSPSQIIGLVGENGNGKTTLLRILYGELKPDSGIIDYAFVRSYKRPFFETKARIAFIPQRPQSWYGSLMDNLQYAAAYTGLKGKANYLWTEMIVARMGLRQFRNYSWSRISSGYKMRFELARTLIRKPEVLLLDEPLANLDMLAQQIILEDLRFLSRSHTMPLSIMLSSQQLYEVEKVSDQVIFLNKGVPKYQNLNQPEMMEDQELIFELETSASREKLLALFEGQGLEKISFNGGVYILYFNKQADTGKVLSLLGNAKMPVRYFRDISESSRRFFVS